MVQRSERCSARRFEAAFFVITLGMRMVPAEVWQLVGPPSRALSTSPCRQKPQLDPRTKGALALAHPDKKMVGRSKPRPAALVLGVYCEQRAKHNKVTPVAVRPIEVGMKLPDGSTRVKVSS